MTIPKTTINEIVRLLRGRCSPLRIADHMGVSRCTVLRAKWAAQSNGVLPNGLKADSSVLPESVCDVSALGDEQADNGPIWSRARLLGLERRLKLRWNLDHIADDLSWLPGPPVHVRDVIDAIRSER